MGVVGCAIGQCANTYTQLKAARIVQGFATSAFESLIMIHIGFWVESSSSVLIVATFIMFTDAVFVQFYPQCNMQAPGLLQSDVTIPIIAGPITTNLGWRWTFDILQIFAVTQFVLIFFFCPETTYIPDSIFEIDQIETEDFEKPGAVEHERETAQTELPRKKTFFQSLAIPS
jgi:MFS family permease